MVTEPSYYLAKRQRRFFTREGAALEGGSERASNIGTQGRSQEFAIRKRYAKVQNADTYLGILRERGKRGLPVERVYRQLFNRELYLKAYGRIYRNHGAMTRGITHETADGMSLEKIATIIQALRQERYHWKPARRVWIPKKNGKKRPLGVTTWSDKLVAEVVRMILDAYFDIQFSDHSHGFREGRGCGSALREIYYTWRGTTWLIEGDISDCFGTLSHELLISRLSEKFQDGRFVRLVKKLLDAGYLEDWRFNQTLNGVPQGPIVSMICHDTCQFWALYGSQGGSDALWYTRAAWSI